MEFLTSAWRDSDGHRVWPGCSLSGHPDPLARLVDPIDPLNPHHDPVHLIAARRQTDHAAQVLALAVITEGRW